MGLYHWQEDAAANLVRILQSGQVAVDSSETGTGKTYTALEVLHRLNKKALVIAPKSAIGSWARVAKEMGLEDRLLKVTNPEQVRLGKTPWYSKGVWTPGPDTMLIWDEVHRGASGPESQQTEMLARTKVYKVPVLTLSATVADSPLKLRGLGFLLGLHDFNQSSYYGWCRRNGCFTIPGQHGLRFYKGDKAVRIMAGIHTQIQDRMVRIKRDEVPEFPECETLVNLYDLDNRATEEVNKIYQEMDARLKLPHSNILVELGRARQRTELFKVPILVELTEDLVEEGKSVVIFVNYRETLARLAKELSKYSVVQLHGDQTETQRTEVIAKFQANQAHIFLAMGQAGGICVSLQDIHHVRPRVSLITPSFSASEFTQTLGRIHRAGGTKAVQIIVLINNTIETRVHAALRGKIDNIEAVSDGDLR